MRSRLLSFATLAVLALSLACAGVGGGERAATEQEQLAFQAATESLAADPDKARRELGYEPRVGLREGIRNTINSYVESGRL